MFLILWCLGGGDGGEEVGPMRPHREAHVKEHQKLNALKEAIKSEPEESIPRGWVKLESDADTTRTVASPPPSGSHSGAGGASHALPVQGPGPWWPHAEPQ